MFGFFKERAWRNNAKDRINHINGAKARIKPVVIAGYTGWKCTIDGDHMPEGLGRTPEEAYAKYQKSRHRHLTMLHDN